MSARNGLPRPMYGFQSGSLPARTASDVGERPGHLAHENQIHRRIEDRVLHVGQEWPAQADVRIPKRESPCSYRVRQEMEGRLQIEHVIRAFKYGWVDEAQDRGKQPRC